MRSTSIGLLLCVIFGVFFWVAKSPRPWNAALPEPAPARVTRAAVFPRPLKSPAWDEAPLERREPLILPLAASRVSFEPEETFSAELLIDEEISRPAAPDFAGETVSSASTAVALPEELPAAWPIPGSLLAQLDEIADVPECRDWTRQVNERLERLSRLRDLDEKEAAATLEELNRLAADAGRLASQLDSPREQTRVRTAGYALARRTAVWRTTHQAAQLPLLQSLPVAFRTSDMLERLEAADALLGQDQRSSDWRRYLLTGRTRLLAEAGQAVDDQERRRHARSVLRRLEWPGLTQEQTRFLQREEFQSLAEELRAWAAEPLDLARILDALEMYEEQPSIVVAGQIAEDRLRLKWAGYPQTLELADRLEEHYRNANVRAAVSDDLLTVLAPETQTSVDRLRDTIVGAAVRGHSQTTARVAFRVIPDERHLRLLLEADGEVATSTHSAKSGAVFHSRGQGSFHAQKEIVFDGEQVSMYPAVADANMRDGLRDVATEYDGVPLLNIVAQTIARQSHAEARPVVRREVERNMAARAASRLDEEAEARLAALEERVEDRVARPLDRLALFAMPIHLETSSSRLIARYRLAGDLQLGAHTPRPQAPSDSLLSVQVHESAVNNALARLPLAGRETDVPGLFREILAIVGAVQQPAPDDLPQNITLQLADEEPVRVDLLEGVARVTVRLNYLKTDNRTWRNITSRAYYKPQADGLTARLVRTGAVELTGDHLRMRDQLALRAVFCKVFTERRALDLIPAPVAQSPKLQPFAVTQLVIREGWIGFALGPRRPVTPGVAMK